MIYKSRQLRRLYQVEIYKTDKRVHTHTETLIAWNAVDANRRVQGELAVEPKPICFVTWDDPPRRIENPTDGALETVLPTIAAAYEHW